METKDRLKKIRLFFLAYLMLIQPAYAADGILIVTHPSHKIQISKEDLKYLYLGTKTMIEGWRVLPLDQSSSSTVRADFYGLLLGKDSTEMKIYWAEQIFSGKARAPKEVLNDEDVIQSILSNPDLIGYVSGSTNISQVNVAQKLE